MTTNINIFGDKLFLRNSINRMTEMRENKGWENRMRNVENIFHPQKKIIIGRTFSKRAENRFLMRKLLSR